MDATISNCPKCGHTVNAAAAACTYCGTALSSGDLSPQPEETRIDINEPDPKAVAGAAAQLSAAGGQMDIQPPVEDPIADCDVKKTAKGQDQAPGLDAVSAEIEKPDKKPDTSSDSDDIVDLERPATQSAAEVIPLADKAAAKTVSSDSPGLPETPVLEVSEEDPSESESPGADVLEPVPDDEFELGVLLDPNASKPSDERAVEEEIDLIQDPTPTQSDTPDGEPEAILLTADDMGQSGTQSTVADAARAGESEVPVESAAAAAKTRPSNSLTAPGEARARTEVIRKQTEALAAVEPIELETAVQDLTGAQKKQEAVQALKRKKLKAAQVQALKKKKQQLDQAQKRKKAAMLKAQALKKQKAAQAGIVRAHKEMAVGSNCPKVDNSNMIVQGRGANTKMLGLLKKYEGQAIGINYDNSADIKEAELVKANDEFFSVSVKDQKLSYSHPLKTILTIIEGEDGVETGKPGQKAKFKAVIKVYPLVPF